MEWRDPAVVYGPGAGLADEKWGTQDPHCTFDPRT
eukprot:COSAG01_NODE_62871_length_282_cov_1.136612_1_plen_34_part_10